MKLGGREFHRVGKRKFSISIIKSYICKIVLKGIAKNLNLTYLKHFFSTLLKNVNEKRIILGINVDFCIIFV